MTRRHFPYHAVALLLAFSLSATLSRNTFDRLAQLEDEIAYWWQAQVFAQGRIVMESPEPAQAFFQPFVLDYAGKSFGKYMPGWPFFLSWGFVLGQPWLVNAAFATLGVAVLYLLARQVFNADTGIIAAPLAAFSPVALLLNASLMSHTVSLFFALGFAYTVSGPSTNQVTDLASKQVEWNKKAQRIAPMPLSSPARKNGWVILVICLVLVGLAFGLYLNTFGNEFTNWDDNRYITDNSRIRDLGIAGAARIFSRFYFSDYAPITLLSYAVDYSIWGLNPLGYHLTNTLLHALNSILLFLLMRQISGSQRVALVTSLLFVAHPVQVESVTWMAQRKNLLAMTFFLLTFIWHVKSRQTIATRHTYVLSWIFYLLAVLSKPVVVGAPVLLAAYDRWFCRLEWRALLRRNAPYFVIAALGVTLGVASQYVAGGVKSFRGESIFLTLLLMLRVLRDYMASLLIPHSLDNLYIYSIDRALHDPGVLLGAGLLVLLLLFAWRQPLGRPFCALAVLWFAVFLLPVSNVIPLAVQRADRYMYFPAIAVFLVVALALEKIWQSAAQRPLALKLSTAGAVAAIIVSCSLATVSRNRVWQGSRTLWEDHLKKYPRSTTGHFNLAGYYLSRRDYDQAVPLYQKLIRIDPKYMKAYFNLATIASDRGIPDEAIGYYEKAIRLDPKEKVLWNNLGYSYYQKGLYGQAIESYQQALRLDPRYVKARTNAGYAYLKSGNSDRAWGYFEAALVVDPDNAEAYRGQGIAFWQAKDVDGSLAAFARAVRLSPRNPGLLAYLARSFHARGDPEQGLGYAQRATELDPRHALAFRVLGDCYAAMGRKDLAQKAYDQGAKLGEMGTEHFSQNETATSP